MWKYIEINAAAGLDPTTRAQLISEELFSISRPPAVRNPDDLSNSLFAVIENNGHAYLMIQLDYVIPVHPLNNVNNLAALFPNLSTEEKSALIDFIGHSQAFEFYQIIPASTPILNSID